MTDINDVMPKIPSMKWGALMNRAPTSNKVKELNKIFPPERYAGGCSLIWFTTSFPVFIDHEYSFKLPSKNSSCSTCQSKGCFLSIYFEFITY